MTTPRTAGLSVMAVYWLALILGMATCIAMRTDASIAAIWTGTVAGTALGHALVLFNTRSWFALLTILTTAAVVGPSAPGELSGSTLWLAFIPAATCAYWSLGDRTTLVAFWFPAVIWMLSILDHAHANGIPDDTGIALLGGLAVLFLLFLKVRESRRVALWSAVAAPATRLAVPRPSVLLKERPGFRLARTGWALVASALAFGATAWVAPHLWRTESLPGEHEIVEADPAAFGLPCCPVEANVVVPKARVKEYFSIGRGHDEAPIEQEPSFSCRACGTDVAIATGLRPTLTEGPYPYDGPTLPYDGPSPYVGPSPASPYPTTYDDTPVGYGHVTTSGEAWAPPSAAHAPTVHWGGDPIGNAAPPSDVTHVPAPIATPAPPIETAPTPSREQAIEALPAPVVAGSLPPQIAPPPQVAPPPSAPDPAPIVAPTPPTPPPPPSHAATTSTDLPPAQHVEQRSSPSIGPSLIQWVGVILGAALLMQLVALGLRPLRRYVTLRHLRRPYWEETVDQRVSNAWQLALVGLRDAGWRSDSQESPRELAKRVGIDGVERCAAILERARHGIGIDADDLSTMTSSADSAYRDARSRLGTVARAVSWLRWPLT